jgi:hypothetical protein
LCRRYVVGGLLDGDDPADTDTGEGDQRAERDCREGTTQVVRDHCTLAFERERLVPDIAVASPETCEKIFNDTLYCRVVRSTEKGCGTQRVEHRRIDERAAVTHEVTADASISTTDPGG